MRQAIIAFVISLFIFGCADEDPSNNYIVMSIGNAQLAESVKARFQEEQVPYKLLSGANISIPNNPKYVYLANNIMNELIQNILPPNRHISLNPDIEKSVFDILERESIPYKSVYVAGHRYIIWEEEYSDAIDRAFVEASKTRNETGTNGVRVEWHLLKR